MNTFARWLAIAAAVLFLWLLGQPKPVIKPNLDLQRIMDLAQKHS